MLKVNKIGIKIQIKYYAVRLYILLLFIDLFLSKNNTNTKNSLFFLNTFIFKDGQKKMQPLEFLFECSCKELKKKNSTDKIR